MGLGKENRYDSWEDNCLVKISQWLKGPLMGLNLGQQWRTQDFYLILPAGLNR